MPVDPACAVPEGLDSEPDVLVARQAVVNEDMRVSGYRVAYAAPEQEPVSTDGRSAIRLFGDVLTVVGLEELVGENVAHLPITRELLLTLGIPPIGPDRVILGLGHATAVDPDVHGILRSLAARGYALAIEADPRRAFDRGLFDLFGIVEFEFRAWDERALAEFVPQIRRHRAIPLAAGLFDHGEFDRARQLGCERFTGPFVASRRITPARSVPVGELTQLAALARLKAGPADIEELEDVINRDLGLSLKLLRYINSAYFGIRNNITSIRQAVMMLGARGVSRWAMLVTLTGAPSAPPELSTLALTRARMCEILARGRREVDREEMFTIGMLSVADALLGVPLEEVIAQLPLADEVVQALLYGGGQAGEILDVVLTYERGNFDAASVRANRRGVARAYLGALRWAEGVVAHRA